MKAIVIRGLSNTLFLGLLFLASFVMFMPFGVAMLVSGPESLSIEESPGAFIFVSVILLVPMLYVILDTVYHYMSRAIISTTEVCIKAPFKKDIIFVKSSVAFFGMVNLGFRDTRLYICHAPKEQILAYFEEHMDACKQAFPFPLISVEEYCRSEETRWIIALKFCIRQRQPGVHFLNYGNKKRAQIMEEAFGKPATNLEMFKRGKLGAGFPDDGWK